MEHNKTIIQKLLIGYLISLFLIFTLNNGFYGWYYHFYLLAANLTVILFLIKRDEKLSIDFTLSAFLNILIIFILSVLFIQLFISPYTYRTFSVFIKVFNFIILFYIIYFFLKKENLIFLFYAIVVTGFLASIYGLYDGYFRDFNLISGTFVNKNIFAGFIILSVNLLYSLFLWSEDKKLKIIAVLLSIPVIAALLFSESMGALFALFMSLSLLTAFKNKRAGLLILSFLVFLSVSSLFFLNYFDIFKKSASISSRLSMWKTTLKVIADNFFTGTGLGMYEEFVRMYDYVIIKSWDLHYAYFPNYAHNEYLQILSDGGIFLFLAAILLVLGAAYKAVKNRKNVSTANKKYFYGFLGVYFTVLFHLVVDCGIEFYPITLAFTVSFAALLKLTNLNEEKEYENPLKNIKFTVFAVSILGLFVSAIVIVSGYFYERGSNFLSKDIDKAVYNLKTAVKLNPFNAAYHALLADAYIVRTNAKKSDEFSYAASEYEKAARLNRYRAEYYFKLANMNGIAYKTKKEQIFFKDAKKYFLKSIELEPYNAQYHLRFGQFYLENNFFKEALSYFKKTSEIEPYYAKSYYFQALALNGLKRYDESREKLLETLKINEKLKRNFEKTRKTPFDKITLKDYEKEMVSMNYNAVYTALYEIEKASGNKAYEKKWKELAEKSKTDTR